MCYILFGFKSTIHGHIFDNISTKSNKFIGSHAKLMACLSTSLTPTEKIHKSPVLPNNTTETSRKILVRSTKLCVAIQDVSRSTIINRDTRHILRESACISSPGKPGVGDYRWFILCGLRRSIPARKEDGHSILIHFQDNVRFTSE